MWLENIFGDLTPQPRRGPNDMAPKQKPRRTKGLYFTGASLSENGAYLNHRSRSIDYFSLELEQ